MKVVREIYRWVMRMVCLITDWVMKVWGSSLERDDLMKRLWMAHYVVLPAILLGFAIFGGEKAWWGVFGFVCFTVMTEVLFKACLISEMESYVKQWGEGERSGVMGWEDVVLRWEKKTARRPLFFIRFVGLGLSCLVIVISIGRFRGYV